MNSSTPRATAAPSARRSMHSAIAVGHERGAHDAPYRREPVGLHHERGAHPRQKRRASSASSKVENRGRDPVAPHQVLDRWEPRRRRARTRPRRPAPPRRTDRRGRTSGASGPITVRSMRSRRANATSCRASTPMSTQRAWRAMPSCRVPRTACRPAGSARSSSQRVLPAAAADDQDFHCSRDREAGDRVA
jgi:hypothetical protein